MHMIFIKFRLNGYFHYTNGSIPCTEKAFHEGIFSVRYILECVYGYISGYMEVKNLEGKPELVNWTFGYVND